MEIKINGVKIYYSVLGRGRQTIVLLHGWGGSAKNLLGLQELLTQKGYKVYTVDLPGFGESQPPEGVWGVGEYSDFVVGFIESVGIKKCFLFGHSFGGSLVIKIASHNREGLKGVILCNASGIRPRSRKLKFLTKVAKVTKPVFRLPGMKRVRKFIYIYLLKSRDYLSDGIKKDSYLKIIRQDITPLFGEIKTPVLIIWGEKDKETPLWMGKLMNEKIQNSELKIIEGEAHGLPKFHPEKIVDLIDVFVKRNS